MRHGVTVGEDDRIVEIRGDKDQPMSRGYACAKGIQAAEGHHGPSRLLRPLKRTAGGDFEEITLTQAFGETADRLKAIEARRDAFQRVCLEPSALNAH